MKPGDKRHPISIELQKQTRLKRQRERAALVPSEAAIEKACTDLLVLDDWRPLKMEYQFSEKKRKATGELNMADHLYIRYGHGVLPETDLHGKAFRLIGGCAQVMWIEWKRLKGKSATVATTEQLKWHWEERARGALTLIAGVDFPASIEGFREWYKASGLMRKRIIS